MYTARRYGRVSMKIESRSNQIVKRVKSLAAHKGREEFGMHLIEGRKLLCEAVISGAEIMEGFVEEGSEMEAAILTGRGAEVYTVTRPVMEALCSTNTPQTVCATVKTPSCKMPETFPGGMIVALDALQDPGNMGTIIRTADAMGAVGIFLGEGCADPFAPKCIRAAMGSTYHIPVWKGNLNEALQSLQKERFICICGHLQGKEQLPPPTDRCVIVIGNEGNGVKEENAALCALVRLPMYGRAESLNASVAASLLMYEVAKAMHIISD